MSGNKLLLMNGPSSAGKSTIAHELRRQLRLCGADPVVISIDAYLRISTDEEIWEDDVFEITPDMCRDQHKARQLVPLAGQNGAPLPEMATNSLK